MSAPDAGGSELSRRDELAVSLWLVAVLLGEVLLVVWFFGRLYST